eukprot:TRINITY_DN1212_c0_g1_i1.p1 TRINITY_DN1212_c0_g1~~TRINITY_DN1212_c0_g1_i1.p1  ORF type:complete len:595 (-),score=112.33 TRINITY_DN1212_c0_g1_i1:32-1816(-)
MKISALLSVLSIVVLLSLYIISPVQSNHIDVTHCDVTIAGGSTAALAAALSSAGSGVKTCLLEPTDWIGGQLTANGVPAIDFAWHTLHDPVTKFTLPVAEIDREEINVTPNFYHALHNQLNTTGRCWVSPFCYPPLELLQNSLWPLTRSLGQNLHIYYNTVVKNVTLNSSGTMISQLLAIQRSPQPDLACNGWDILTSLDIHDWYSFSDSRRWIKTSLSFTSRIYMDGTNWGELLPLSNAPYLVGADERWDGDTSGTGGDINKPCGQSIAYDFTQTYHTMDVEEPGNPFPVRHEDGYGLQGFTWDKIWTYRRILSTKEAVTPKDSTLQNWSGGNDYIWDYLFLSKNQTQHQVKNNDWVGGVNISVLTEAEYYAYGYHYWFKSKAPKEIQKKLVLNRNNSTIEYDRVNSMGTCHGLSKLPYMRDSRRTIGIGNFVMKVTNIAGNATQMTGNQFFDRIAIGCYDADIHKIKGCGYKSWQERSSKYGILPFFLPFRSMTNEKVGNLMVLGLSIGQSFVVSMATRLHPVEWSGGTAGGAVAAWMVQNGVKETRGVLGRMEEVRSAVEKFTPTAWTIQGKKYPPNWHHDESVTLKETIV